MSAHPSKVNLVPPSEFEQSFWGKFLKWAVTTGRYIIILTEMVVILAFLSRFKLDEDVRNLNEQINGQVAFLDSQKPQLEKFTALQEKLNLTDKVLASVARPLWYLNYVDERIGPDLVVTRRNVIPMGVQLSAVTLSDVAMGQLIASISADPIWKSVTVDELVQDKTNGTKFTITAKK